jgi:2-hydroxychromene-2-carboxylate isomerase
MSKHVDYYLSVVSPWTYLGHDRFVAICAQHGATIDLKPMDIGKVFAVSGGLPLKQRAPQRQAYRLIELARWRDYLGLPLNAQPKFAASGGDLASCWIIAALDVEAKRALDFAGAVMRARWAEERDIADAEALGQCAAASGLDPGAVAERAGTAEIAARYEAFTQEAIDCQVFGAPWYVIDGEPFWGQDRLEFVDLALRK